MMDRDDQRVKDLQQAAWGLQSLCNKPGGRLPEKFKSQCYKLGGRALSLCSDVEYTEEQDFVERSKIFHTQIEAKKVEVGEVEAAEKAKITGKCYRASSDGNYTVCPVSAKGVAQPKGPMKGYYTPSLTDVVGQREADLAFSEYPLKSTVGGARSLTLGEVVGKCRDDPEMLSLCGLGLGDSDVDSLCQGLKQAGAQLTSLDVSHNLLADVGVQKLVSSLVAGACPKLQELHIGFNSFGVLGTQMLKGGLSTLRRNLVVHMERDGDVISSADAECVAAPQQVAQELGSPVLVSAKAPPSADLVCSSLPQPDSVFGMPAFVKETRQSPDTDYPVGVPSPSAVALDGKNICVDLVKACNGEGLQVRTVLAIPEGITSAGELDLDVSTWRIVVRLVSGALVADVALPCAVVADTAHPLFSRKRRILTVTFNPQDQATAAAAATAIHGA